MSDKQEKDDVILPKRRRAVLKLGEDTGGSKSPTDDKPSGSSATTNNGNVSPTAETAKAEVRVGKDYQAELPVFEKDLSKGRNLKDKDMCVWRPNSLLKEKELIEYMQVAKEKYGFSMEQSLGMLQWHKYNFDKAMVDFANYVSFPDCWTPEDKVLFEEAFQQHGKSFARIRNMLPSKTIASLVKYYYSWKKQRHQRGYLEAKQQSRLHQVDLNSDDSSGDDSDTNNAQSNSRRMCSNCGQPMVQPHESPKGMLCLGCFQYYRSTGSMRSKGWSGRKPLADAERSAKGVKKPKNINVELEDLKLFSSKTVKENGLTPGEDFMNQMERQVQDLKSQVQLNRQAIGHLKQRLANVGSIENYRPKKPNTEDVPKQSHRWTDLESLLSVQALRRYGKNYRAIAETLGTKSEHNIRTWFGVNQQRLNLDKILADHAADVAKTKESDEICLDSDPEEDVNLPQRDQAEASTSNFAVAETEDKIAASEKSDAVEVKKE